jgi:hypothetical protein
MFQGRTKKLKTRRAKNPHDLKPGELGISRQKLPVQYQCLRSEWGVFQSLDNLAVAHHVPGRERLSGRKRVQSANFGHCCQLATAKFLAS